MEKARIPNIHGKENNFHRIKEKAILLAENKMAFFIVKIELKNSNEIRKLT